MPGIKLYVEGVRKVLGKTYELGVYSCGVVCQSLLDEKLCDFTWLSASRAFEGSKAFYASKRWDLAQDPKVDQDWDGLSVDLNEYREMFGQFRVATE